MFKYVCVDYFYAIVKTWVYTSGEVLAQRSTKYILFGIEEPSDE